MDAELFQMHRKQAPPYWPDEDLLVRQSSSSLPTVFWKSFLRACACQTVLMKLFQSSPSKHFGDTAQQGACNYFSADQFSDNEKTIWANLFHKLSAVAHSVTLLKKKRPLDRRNS